MKLTKIDSYEIQAFAFRVMTGYVAPGKDASPLADEASYEERCAAFDEWRNEHAPCILAMLHGFEALIDRNDEPTRALLDRLEAAEKDAARPPTVVWAMATPDGRLCIRSGDGPWQWFSAGKVVGAIRDEAREMTPDESPPWADLVGSGGSE